MLKLRIDCRECGKTMIKLGNITLHKGADQEGYYYSLTCPNCGATEISRTDDFLARLLGGDKMSLVSLEVLDDHAAADLIEDRNNSGEVTIIESRPEGLKNIH